MPVALAAQSEFAIVPHLSFVNDEMNQLESTSSLERRRQSSVKKWFSGKIERLYGWQTYRRRS